MRNLKAEKYDSIPSLSFPGDNIPELELKDDRFVDIEEYSGGQIICRPAYFLRGIKGAGIGLAAGGIQILRSGCLASL